MIICNNCGKDVEDSMRFCSECGGEISVQPETEFVISKSRERGKGKADARARRIARVDLESHLDDTGARNPGRVQVALLVLGVACFLVFAGGAVTWLIIRSKAEPSLRGGSVGSNSNREALALPSSTGSAEVISVTRSAASTGPYTPKPGSAERKLIMDALRKPVEDKLTKQVIFKVDHLKVKDGWAFMRGVPKKPDGSPMNYRDTAYRSAVEEGAFDDWICALLQQQGDDWRLVTFIIGATDVGYQGWDQKYRAPSEIFR